MQNISRTFYRRQITQHCSSRDFTPDIHNTRKTEIVNNNTGMVSKRNRKLSTTLQRRYNATVIVGR